MDGDRQTCAGMSSDSHAPASEQEIMIEETRNDMMDRWGQ